MKKTHSKSFKLLLLAMLMLNMEAIGQQVLKQLEKQRRPNPAQRKAGVQKVPAPTIKSIKAAADTLLAKSPGQKVYIQTDKHQYNIGDTIWIKAYVLDAIYFKAATNSRVLFVELHDDTAEVVRRIGIPLQNGLGTAQIPLTKEIFHEGGYSIVAYTNWMQHFGPEGVFRKRFYLGRATKDSWLVNSGIKVTNAAGRTQVQAEVQLRDLDQMPVGFRKLEVKVMDDDIRRYKETIETSQEGGFAFSYDLPERRNGSKMRLEIRDLRNDAFKQVLKIPLTVDRPQKIDVQFLPEGGNLVAGLQSVVAFKAIAESGKGIDVSGRIYDSKGKEVTAFASLHNGMGNFKFKPVLNEKYMVKLTRPEGASHTFNLPKVNATGTTLHVDNTKNGDSIKIDLNASIEVINGGGVYYLIGSARGAICYGMPFVFKGNRHLNVAKKLFPSGVVRFSLLKGITPVAERLTYIDHQDQLDINVTAHKKRYLKRDSVSLDITVKDPDGNPVAGSFSLAVTDDNAVRPDSSGNFDITGSLLLCSNLKGLVEDPGYYFKNQSVAAWAALDQLLMTQGWIGFDWRDVFTPQLQVKAALARQKNTDNENKSRFMVFPEISFSPLQPWFTDPDGRQRNHAKRMLPKVEAMMNLSGNMLDEVVIRSKKRDYSGYNRNGIGHANVVLDSADIALSATTGLYQLLKQKIPALKIGYYYSSPLERGYTLKLGYQFVKIAVDSHGGGSNFLAPTPQALKNKLNSVQVHNFRMVEVMYSQKYLIRYFPPTPGKQFVSGAAVDIIKNGGLFPGSAEKEYALVTITTSKIKKVNPNPNSIVLPQKFYSPRYNAKTTVELPDYRSTLHWEPNVTTDAFGKARVSFYTSDLPGSYTINLQGTNMNGNIGSYAAKIKVE